MKTILLRMSLLLATVACLTASEDPKTAIWLAIAALLAIFVGVVEGNLNNCFQ